MRFITEFEITKEDKKHDNWLEFVLAKQKYNRQAEMGGMIANLFGWQSPVMENNLRYRLEIEAFPTKDYLVFKRDLIDYLVDRNINPDIVIGKFKTIESIGKQKTHE
jgi:hypothetical protein